MERLVVTMPTPEAKTNPLTLAACSVAGVDEVYRVGGAQAIAHALAQRVAPKTFCSSALPVPTGS